MVVTVVWFLGSVMVLWFLASVTVLWFLGSVTGRCWGDCAPTRRVVSAVWDMLCG